MWHFLRFIIYSTKCFLSIIILTVVVVNPEFPIDFFKIRMFHSYFKFIVRRRIPNQMIPVSIGTATPCIDNKKGVPLVSMMPETVIEVRKRFILRVVNLPAISSRIRRTLVQHLSPHCLIAALVKVRVPIEIKTTSCGPDRSQTCSPPHHIVPSP